MSLIYVGIANVDGFQVGAIVELSTLPRPIKPIKVVDTEEHLNSIYETFLNDLERSSRMLSNIDEGTFGVAETSFLTDLYSFWENLPQPTEERHGVFVLNGDDFLVHRYKPDYAAEFWSKLIQC